MHALENWYPGSLCCFPADMLSSVVSVPGVFLPTVQTPGGTDVSLSFLLDGSVFIAWRKYNQKVPIKLCYYCSTKLEMLEVSASWLFHAAMNILWERKYLVSDSFYSAATPRAAHLPDLTRIKVAACPSLHSLLHKTHRALS